MRLDGTFARARIAPLLARRRVFSEEPVSLVDVGVSGGEHPSWTVFEPDLRVVGFDPLVTEVERLKRERGGPRRDYVAAWVGAPERGGLHDEDRVSDLEARAFACWTRTSSARAIEILGYDSDSEYQGGGPVVHAREHLSLDAFGRDRSDWRVDFLKTDTDGHDLDVLRGAEESLRTARVLGLQVECPVHGPPGEKATNFANVDSFLRARGFFLFDVIFHRYARAALPSPFLYPMPAQTSGGQPIAADTFYLRDAAGPGYEERCGFNFSPVELLKLTCFLELYGLPDCAAEILVERRDRIDAFLKRFDLDCTALLDSLVPKSARPRSYAEYVAWFEADPRRLFPSNPAIGRLPRRLLRRIRRLLST